MSSASTVQSSQLLALAEQQGQPDRYDGRRKQTRYALGMHVELSTDPDHSAQLQDVMVHNVSAGGVGVWSQRQFPEGADVSIRDGDGATWITGKVQHSSPGMGGHLIGIKLDEEFQESCASNSQGDTSTNGDHGRSQPIAETNFLSRLPLALVRIVKGSLTGLMIACGVYAGLRILDFEIFASEVAIGFAGSVLIGAGIGLLGVRRETRFLSGIASAIDSLCADGELPALPAAPTRRHAAIHSELLKLAESRQQQSVESKSQWQQNAELEGVKSGILSIVLRDLRIPLQAIRQHAEVLREEVDSLSRENRLDLIETIAQQSTSIAHQVGDLEELQRLDADMGNGKVACEPCSIEETIADSMRGFESMAQSRSIGLHLECPSSLPPAFADAERIARVLKSLVSNAIKHSPDGGAVTVEVEERPCELVVSVSDSGPGIPRERWGAVFERFARLDDPQSGRAAGLGLGLYIARRIVEADHGRIWLDSEVGSGTTVYFAIPTDDTPAEQVSTMDAFAGSCRVVVCDSDPELAAMMAQALRARHYQVSVAHCGGRLLELLDHEALDVVVTDVQLADMSTAELLSALQSRREQGFTTIFHSFEEKLRVASQPSVVACLHRPSDRRRLYEAVEFAAKRRFASGKTVFMLEHGSMETRRLRGALEDAGHAVLSCVSMKEIGRLLKCYRCDSVLIPDGALSGDWGGLRALHPSESDHARIIVMVTEARRRERVLEEQFGVTAVVCRPGSESNVLAEIEAEAVAAPVSVGSG